MYINTGQRCKVTTLEAETTESPLAPQRVSHRETQSNAAP